MNVNSQSQSQSQSQSTQAKAQLKKISNSTLLDEVKSLVGREKALTSQVIECLKEIDSRKLFLECGYPSLFAFAVGFLGYSEAEAQIRIGFQKIFWIVSTPMRRTKVLKIIQNLRLSPHGGLEVNRY